MDGGGVTKDGELPDVAPEEVHSDRELKDRMEQVGLGVGNCVCWSDGLSLAWGHAWVLSCTAL
jgi:hypothetical protein